LPAFPSPDLLRSLLSPLADKQPESAAFAVYRQWYGTQFVGVQSHSGLLAVQDYPLVAQLWLPAAPQATLVFLHGYYDHVGLYRHLIGWALGRNMAVLACDLPGHGLSGGARADIGDFAEYRAALLALLQQAQALQLPQPWHVLGQSTGGGIVLDCLLRGLLPVQTGHIALLAPLIRPRAWGLSKLLWHLLHPFTSSIPRRFSDNSTDAEFLAFLRQDPLQPLRLPCRWVQALMHWVPHIESAAPSDHRHVVIVQGQADHTLAWQHNLHILQEKLPHSQQWLLPHAKHHLVNESLPLRQACFAFLAQHLQPNAPSPTHPPAPVPHSPASSSTRPNPAAAQPAGE